MTWDDVIDLDKKGMKIGPHSRFHNILTKLPKRKMVDEIDGSWIALKAKLERPAPVFCYPIGKQNDFGEREIKAVIESGMDGAVTSILGEVDPGSWTGVRKV